MPDNPGDQQPQRIPITVREEWLAKNEYEDRPILVSSDREDVYFEFPDDEKHYYCVPRDVLLRAIDQSEASLG